MQAPPPACHVSRIPPGEGIPGGRTGLENRWDATEGSYLRPIDLCITQR